MTPCVPQAPIDVNRSRYLGFGNASLAGQKKNIRALEVEITHR